MTFRQTLISTSALLLSALFVVAGTIVLKTRTVDKPTVYYQQQLSAATAMRECIDSLGVHPDYHYTTGQQKIDPNRTNLIGVEYSPLTTTLGDLIAKRSSTNPDFAALLVHWFYEIGVQPGDVVAAGCSGSFPALILATICAAEAMDVKLVLIVSLGASSYGANRPQFTWLEMESYLRQQGLITTSTTAVSLGGARDVALDLEDGVRAQLRQMILKNGISFIFTEDSEKNVQQRAKIYTQFGEPVLFVNIGGAQINIGGYALEKRLRPGINHIRLQDEAPESMITWSATQSLPIIHLLHIEKLLLVNGMPVDPVPLPEPGQSRVYYISVISTRAMIIALLLFVFGATVLLWKKIRN